MKLNLGCGFNKLSGFVNIDNHPLCKPDMCFDLEQQWPLEDSSVYEIVMHHTMEHLGETTAGFISFMKEMYRVSADECYWKITVPHPNTDMFNIDPTHVRRIYPMTLRMFDQEDNVRDLKAKGHYTKLGLFHNIDIEVIREQYYLVEPWYSQLATGKITNDQVSFAAQHYVNMCHEMFIECLVHKPQRYSYEDIEKLYAEYT